MVAILVDERDGARKSGSFLASMLPSNLQPVRVSQPFAVVWKPPRIVTFEVNEFGKVVFVNIFFVDGQSVGESEAEVCIVRTWKGDLKCFDKDGWLMATK